MVERHLAKVNVAGSNLVSRSTKPHYFFIRRHSQVVRQGSAKPSFPSSNLGGASKKSLALCEAFFCAFLFLFKQI